MFNTKPAVVERAEALLRAHCTAEQRANWEQNGWLWPICGSAGGSFAFGTWAAANMTGMSQGEPKKLFYQVWEYDPGTRDARYRWCVLPMNGYGELPEYDCILGTKLLLEADEPGFRAIARQQWAREGLAGPGQPMPGLRQDVEAIIQQRINAAVAAQQQAAMQHMQNAANQLYGLQQQAYYVVNGQVV